MTKLRDVQKRLKAPKNQRSQNNRYLYRSCEDILEAVKPLMGDARLVVTDEVVQVGERYYVKAKAVFEGEDSAEAYGWAREEDGRSGMSASQLTGAASSYARKYALCGLFCVDGAEDADALPEPEPVQKPRKKQMDKELMEDLAEACRQACEITGEDLKSFKKDAWSVLEGQSDDAIREYIRNLYDFIGRSKAEQGGA